MLHVLFQARPCGSCGNGTCDGLTGNCTCKAGYFGAAPLTCQTYCPGSSPCNGRGTCSLADNKHHLPGCSCQETFSGLGCARRICPSCLNKGVCARGNQTLTSDWGCTCGALNLGSRCEQWTCPGSSGGKFCSNNGKCDLTNGKCKCAPRYSGKDCATVEPLPEPIGNVIDVSFVWGITSYSKKNTSHPVLDRSFNFLSKETQDWVQYVVSTARNSSNLKVRDDLLSFPEEFRKQAIKMGLPYPIPEPGSANYSAHVAKFLVMKALATGRRLASNNTPDTLLSMALDLFFLNHKAKLVYGSDIGTVGAKYKGRVFYVKAMVKTDVKKNAGPHKLKIEYDKWEKFVEDMNEIAPADMKMLMVSNPWTQMKAELDVVNSTISAFAASILFTLAQCCSSPVMSFFHFTL